MTCQAKTLVLIPAYNESATVAEVVRAVLDAGFPALVVDDGSRDDTYRRAIDAGANAIRLPVNLGVGGALRCGFRWAVKNGFDTVVQCDADGQHSPSQIADLVQFAILNDLHLAIGSRFLGGSHFTSNVVRRIPMRVMALLASRAAGVRLTDTSSGFRVIRGTLLREFARKFPVHYLGDTFDVTVEAGRRGYRIGEAPAIMHERAGGIPSNNAFWSTIYLIRSFAVLMIGTVNHYRDARAERS